MTDDPVDYEMLERMIESKAVKHCIDCKHYRAESGASGVYSYGQCAKIHTNANNRLMWRYPVQIPGVEGYVPGACVSVYEDFGCVLWEAR
jgi:hypothetical protein